MRIPEPGMTADVLLCLTHSEYKCLIEAVDRIDNIIKDGETSTTNRMANCTAGEWIRFAKAVTFLANFVKEEIFEI